MNNIMNQTMSQCSGCGACLSVCAASAISLGLNKFGFFQAFVDENKCINCGRCQKACTRFCNDFFGFDIRRSSIYALQSRNEETVKRCSSGGAAHEIADWALKHGYLLCGAVYDLETDIVRHVITDDISLLDGSKYLQSNTSVFADVIKKAQSGQKYAVFGVPCQIAGIANAAEIKKCRDKLLLIEIFCHGVPTYKLWEEECNRVRGKLNCKSFDSVQFRYKKNGWHSYCLRFVSQGTVWYGLRENDLFYRTFFDDMVLNHSCMDCRMRKEHSLADFRLGDYWGKRYKDRDDGVSIVFCNTPFSMRVIRELSVRELETGSAEEALSCQNMKGYSISPLYNNTMDVLAKDGLKKAVRYYRYRMPIKHKVKNLILSIMGLMPDKIRETLRKK